MDTESTLHALLRQFPRAGRVEWIAVRPARHKPPHPLERIWAEQGVGLQGDHYRARGRGKRQVSLIQAEHLPVVAALLGMDTIDPARLRRNIVVSGINLLALKDQVFRIGEAVFEGSGLCHPCSRMESELGEGGYNAMRGHGGITARVIHGAAIAVGDRVAPAAFPSGESSRQLR